MAALTLASELREGDVLDGNETVTKAPRYTGLNRALVEFTTDWQPYLVRADSLWWVHTSAASTWARDEKAAIEGSVDNV